MPKVVSLPTRRAEPYRCDCGSEWFRLIGTGVPPSVSLDAAGNITAYAGTVVCDQCGASVPRRYA